MRKLRKSLFLRGLCHLMVIAIFFVSCDPNGNSLVDSQLDKQAEIALEDFGSILSERDCENFKEIVDAVKGFVWLTRQGGQSPSQQDVTNFVYDLHVKKGLIKYDKEQKQAFSEMASSNMFMGDHEQVIQNLIESKQFSAAMGELASSFSNEFAGVKSYDEGFEVIEAYKNSELIASLNELEKESWTKSMSTAETGLCYEMESNLEQNNKDLCEECIWELNWVKVIIAVVVTVLVWLFAVITLGWGTLLASVVSVAVWTAIWVLHCYWVECEASGPCPEGQQPFCETGFVLMVDDGVCSLDPIYQNATLNSDNCIKVDKLVDGTCPGVSVAVPGLSQCILDCYGTELPEGFGQPQGGTFIYPFECI